MPDLEKVISAIENCTGQPKCRDCPWEDCEYEHEVINSVPYSLMRDALELLRERDSATPIWDEGEDIGIRYPYCGACGEPLWEDDTYCSHCGKAVKWDEP